MIAKRLVYVMVGVLALALWACASIEDKIPVTGAGNDGTILENTRWRLLSYGEPGSEIPILKGAGVTLHFGDNGFAGGSAGCNTFGAQYEGSGGGQLSITDIASTVMACSDTDLMEQETQYLDALRAAESFEFTGESLRIYYATGVLNFSRIASHIPNTVNL